MATYIRTVTELVRRGMRRDKALATVYWAFALTPEQVAALDAATK